MTDLAAIKTYEDVKTWEDACLVNGDDPQNLPDVSKLPEDEQKYMVNHYKLVRVAKALNKVHDPKWRPNFHGETTNKKYYPWFEVKADKKRPAGFGFSSTHYDGWDAHSHVGSRLCYATYEIALYAAEQFKDLYLENQLILE